MVPFWADKTDGDDPVVAHMSKPKYVAFTTLDSTDDWADSTLISDDVAGQLSRLKDQPGKNILIIASAALVRWLLREGLLDQLGLLVFPIVIGGGKHLFDNGGQNTFNLTGSEAFSNGVVHLTYQKA
jgi:dihydrofolate reductase